MIHPLLHIGYHKTGTTWLQRHVFKNAEAGFVTPFDKRNEIPEVLIYPNALDFDVQKARDYFRPAIEQHITQGIIPVLSSERLEGDPHSGGYDSKELAHRLAEVFPDGRVLIVIREQKSMILSVYKQYVNVGGACSIAEYLQPSYSRGRMLFFDFNHFKYHRLIKHYFNLFGRERVLVLPYESFRREPENYVGAIIEFAGGKLLATIPHDDEVNRAPSTFAMTLQRRLNPIAAADSVNPWVMIRSPRVKRLVHRIVRHVSLVVPDAVNKKLDTQIKARISDITGERYRESNRRTAELLGRDLKPFLYDL